VARTLTILFGVTSRSWGGNEKWTLEAARSLRARGHSVKVLWSYAPILEQLEARGLPARHLRLPGDVNPVSFFSFARAIRAERPDVLVLTKQREYWVGGLAARLAGRPLVALRLGLARPLKDDLKRRLSFGRFADLVIVNSRGVADALGASPWFDQKKVRVLLNGVDGSACDPRAGRKLLESLGVPPGAPAVVGAGRLTGQKGFDVLIRAFGDVLAAVPAARLVILGEGGRRPDLEAEAARAGVAGAVVFAGHRDDVREILVAASVYALSSRNEGMANTLLEAMSVGSPIVATDVSGTREAVRNGEDAVVVAPEDPAALARGIVTLLRDADLARRLGESARARALALFTYERMAEELERMFLEAFGWPRSELKSLG
jgi:glycosyltransferase involved in cell wall biosynthesis